MKNFFALILLALVVGCGSDDGDSDAPELSTLTIESSNGIRLDLGETTTLTARGFDMQGAPFSALGSITWTASNNNVSVDQNGLVTSVAVGDASITLSAGTKSQSIDISVWNSNAPRTEIWISDSGIGTNPKYQILKYDEDGSNQVLFTDQDLASPQGIVILEEAGEVLISNFLSGNINRYNINTGAFIGLFATSLNLPTRMKIGPDNLLYVLQYADNSKVLRFELDGTFMGEFTSVGMTQNIGMDWDSEGNLYVVSYNNFEGGLIRKFDTDGNDLGVFISSNLRGPTNIWFTANGDLMAIDWFEGLIARFDSEGNFISNDITGLLRPEGVAVFPNGDFLIGNGATGDVKMYDNNNDYISDIITNTSSDLKHPNVVVLRKVN